MIFRLLKKFDLFIDEYFFGDRLFFNSDCLKTSMMSIKSLQKRPIQTGQNHI
jgi:hypothetical protein